MTDCLDLECQVCQFFGLEDGCDGYFYCQRCGSQADGLRVTAVENDDYIYSRDPVIRRNFVQRRTPVAVKSNDTFQPPTQFWETLKDERVVDIGKPPPPRKLTYEDYYSETRMRYVMGVQIMIQLQTKALVEKFHACPLIVGMIQPIWFRFLKSTKIFSDDWPVKVINESESHLQGKGEIESVAPMGKHKAEPHNLLGKRCVILWYESLAKTIPLSYSLVICFLVCHLAREPILPTDIIKWMLEGKLPYLAAFKEIEKKIGPPTNASGWLTSIHMFRPVRSISIQKLESLAASFADSIGLELPPVNFYAIASRYLKQLSLPVETILPYACRIHEWSLPTDLWLSTNESRFPTRACVLSILIVSIRIHYSIHGFGNWESSLSNSDVGDPATEQSNLDATEILILLESKYSDLIDTSDHWKDLEKYLEYCKDVVFAKEELSFEDHEEDEIIKDLWNFYKKSKDHKPLAACSSSHTGHSKSERMEPLKDDVDKERTISRMKSNMEENRFCYIPPRTKVKRNDYLLYTRKKGDGAYVYAAHADYYILLRSCARVAQLDVRTMHDAVLSFERRLVSLEKNIDNFLK